MLDINWGDVENVLKLCIPHLVFLAVVLVAAIAVMVTVKGKDKPTKFLVCAQAGMAIFVALAVVVNLVCFGPVSQNASHCTGCGVCVKRCPFHVDAKGRMEEIAQFFSQYRKRNQQA